MTPNTAKKVNPSKADSPITAVALSMNMIAFGKR
jgi:hypothetical protein